MKRVDELDIPQRRALVRDLVQAVLAAAVGGSHLEEAVGRGVQGQQQVPELLGGFFDHAELGSVAPPGPAGGPGAAAYVFEALANVQLARHGHALYSSLELRRERKGNLVNRHRPLANSRKGPSA